MVKNILEKNSAKNKNNIVKDNFCNTYLKKLPLCRYMYTFYRIPIFIISTNKGS